MTREDFAVVMGVLKAGTGATVTSEQAAVYFDLLHDLPLAVVQAAAKQVLLDHHYPTIPPVGAIRKAAVALQSPPAIPGPEAWRLFLAAVRKYRLEPQRRLVAGQWREVGGEQQGLASLPPDVAHAARCFGWRRLCDTMADHLGIAERDFLQVYATLGKHAERHAVLPPSVAAVAAIAGGMATAHDAVRVLEAKP